MKHWHKVDTVVMWRGLEWHVSGEYQPMVLGRFSGPPEHCYPDEPSQWDNVQVFLVNNDGFLSPDLAEFLTTLKLLDDKHTRPSTILDYICAEAEEQLLEETDGDEGPEPEPRQED